MAVVQISRIQLRRGRKKADTGMPQLASGELAWAIDTQELFIGNGSVGEGAPYVGNTKVLTEHDNLLELLRQYQYKETDPNLQTGIDLDTLESSSSFPIRRTLQDRLDEGRVNARSFGILPSPYPVGSGETVASQTARLNKALIQLYGSVTPLNTVLEFDPGTYQFDDTIVIPSGSKILGSGKGTTVFEFLSSGTAIETSDSTNVMLGDFSVRLLNSDTTGLILTNATACNFKGIRFEKSDGSSVGTAVENTKGIEINQFLASATTTNQNLFDDIEFHGLTYAVGSSGDCCYNFFKNCIYRNLFKGINLGLAPAGSALYNSFVDSVFDTITEQAISVEQGYGNKSRGNTFVNVGSDTGGTGAAHSIIKFLSPGNSSSQDYFERSRLLNDVANLSFDYVPEIEGPVYREDISTAQISLPTTLTPVEGFRLPISSFTNLEVDYIFSSTTFQQTRTGTLSIVVDRTTDSVQLVDDYEYVGPAGGENSVIFSAELKTPQDFGGTGVAKSVVVSYINKNEPTDTNSFTYTYSIRI